MTKYTEYEKIKQNLQQQGVVVGNYQEISYGLQFDITYEQLTSKVRIYESKKKGVSVDLSQVKHQELKSFFNNINDSGTGTQTQEVKATSIKRIAPTGLKSDQFDNALIGVDESGKGDYFGPLVIAGVYADREMKMKLMAIGVADSKTLSDTQIQKMAIRIREICPYEIISIGNVKYNELYDKIKNLNRLLAWGHARIIENLVGQTGCSLALSDQFGDESLIKRALMERGGQIILEQKPKAEQNVVVAAASILARDMFVTKMQELEIKYGQKFPKGASNQVVKAAKAYAGQYGKQRLNEVSKLHFKTTQTV
ncbi:MAG: ribonuclease HIII [Cellulosilyticaceae bacterium]